MLARRFLSRKERGMARSARRRGKSTRGKASRKERGGGATRKPPVPAETREEILRLVDSGRRAIDVAKEYDVHPCTISCWRRAERQHAKAREDAGGVEAKKPSAEEASRETGRYDKAFKLEALKQVFSGRKIVEVAAQYDLPARTLHRWLADRADSAGPVPEAKSTRPHSSGPSPIQEEHRALVLGLKEKHPNMGLAQIQNQLKRFHALKLSRHMIGRIFTEAGIPLQKRSAASTQADRAKNRFEMTRPGELWAIDFKEIWIQSEKAHALFILDDFSRFCVGFALTQEPSAEIAIRTVEAAIQRYGRPERILSDRGPQFHAWNGVSRFDEYLADFLVEHTVTKADHAFTNGKLEAFNRSLETDVLDVEEFASLKEAEEKIRAHTTEYNFRRTHMGIGGLVPADRFFGMVEEAQKALEDGLRTAGPGLGWLRGIVTEERGAARRPTVLQLVVRDGKLELLVLGRRFTLGQ